MGQTSRSGSFIESCPQKTSVAHPQEIANPRRWIIFMVSSLCPCFQKMFIIRLEGRLQPNIGFTLQHILAHIHMFTCSAVTLLKMNQFGWVHSGGLALADFFGAICAVAIAGEPCKILCFCHVINAQFYRFPVCQISWNLNATHCLVSRWKLSEHNFKNFFVRGRFSKKNKKISKNNLLPSCNFRPP